MMACTMAFNEVALQLVSAWLSHTLPAACPGDTILAAAAQHISSILSHFNQQNLALALWAFAKLGWRPHQGLLADACLHALPSLHSINPQNLSNTLWALATMEFVPPPAMVEVCANHRVHVDPFIFSPSSVQYVAALLSVSA